MASKDEKRRGHPGMVERVQNEGRRARIGAIVEGDAGDGPGAGQTSEHGPENPRVPMPCAVRGEAGDGETSGRHADHTEMATRPITW